MFGLVGMIFAPAIALLLPTPLQSRYALYEAWDWRGEAVCLALGLLVGTVTCWCHRERIFALFNL